MVDCKCFSGTRGDVDYQPRGSLERIHDFNVYQLKASGTGDSKGEILFFPDGFGLATHNMILADRFSAKGYNVTLIDYYHGKALPEIYLQYRPGLDLEGADQFSDEEKMIIRNTDPFRWVREMNSTKVHLEVVTFVNQFQRSLSPSQKLYLVGHCFGGTQVLMMASHDLIRSAVAMHPGLETVDLRYPLLVGLAEADVFESKAVAQILQTLSRSIQRYKVGIYGGTEHGFASRADPNDDFARVSYECSITDTIDWFDGTRD